MADFRFVDNKGNPTRGRQSLGAAGPQKLTSPVYLGALVGVSAVDPGCTGSSTDPATACTQILNGSNTLISLRRKITNNTGLPITRLRFRITDLTTLPASAGVADLRAVTS